MSDITTEFMLFATSQVPGGVEPTSMIWIKHTIDSASGAKSSFVQGPMRCVPGSSGTFPSPKKFAEAYRALMNTTRCAGQSGVSTLVVMPYTSKEDMTKAANGITEGGSVTREPTEYDDEDGGASCEEEAGNEVS